MLKRGLWGVAPFLAGSIGILAWNFVTGHALHALGLYSEVGPEADLASRTTAEHAVMLVQTTLAGVVGALFCTRVARQRPQRHMLVFFAVWLALDILSLTLGPARVLPLWVRLGALALVPPQLYAGYRLGLRWRGGEPLGQG